MNLIIQIILDCALPVIWAGVVVGLLTASVRAPKARIKVWWD